MILTQLVKADVLARLTESQLAILNSVVEAEIIQNASIRRTIDATVQGATKSLQATAKASPKKG